jgi:hypothetical protein
MTDADDFAESFYAKMEKPVPPNDDRLFAQERLVVQPAPQTAPRGPDEAEAAARRFYGQKTAQDRAEAVAGENVAQKPEATQAPPDGPDKHEEARAREAARAESMFGGTPMDGVRYDEVELTSPNEFSLDVPEDLAANLGEGEAQQIVSSFIEAGVGRTFAVDLVRQGVEASRRGPLSDDQVQRRNTDGMAALREKWGSQTGAKIELARGMIAAAEAKWPGVKDYLNRSGLGSDPKLIQQLVARAERRPGRR